MSQSDKGSGWSRRDFLSSAAAATGEIARKVRADDPHVPTPSTAESPASSADSDVAR